MYPCICICICIAFVVAANTHSCPICKHGKYKECCYTRLPSSHMRIPPLLLLLHLFRNICSREEEKSRANLLHTSYEQKSFSSHARRHSFVIEYSWHSVTVTCARTRVPQNWHRSNCNQSNISKRKKTTFQTDQRQRQPQQFKWLKTISINRGKFGDYSYLTWLPCAILRALAHFIEYGQYFRAHHPKIDASNRIEYTHTEPHGAGACARASIHVSHIDTLTL